MEDAEVAGDKEKPPAVIGRAELQWARFLRHRLPAESQCLPDVHSRMVDLGCLAAPFLQLEILDSSSQPPKLRQRTVRNAFGSEIGLGASPHPHPPLQLPSSRQSPPT